MTHQPQRTIAAERRKTNTATAKRSLGGVRRSFAAVSVAAAIVAMASLHDISVAADTRHLLRPTSSRMQHVFPLALGDVLGPAERGKTNTAAAKRSLGGLRRSFAAEADALIAKVVAQTTRSGVTVRATRDLRASTRSGKHHGWMAVETVATTARAFTWTVLDEGGSERTRNKVFRELLEEEARTWRDGSGDSVALTPANYDFVPMPPSDAGEIHIRMKPKRADARLIDGTLTVSSDGYPLLLEGKLAKSPSFWVKSVTVVKRYGRFAGVALPTTLESLADVKLVGQSTFTMRYRYREVNGRSVSDAVAALAPTFGPRESRSRGSQNQENLGIWLPTAAHSAAWHTAEP